MSGIIHQHWWRPWLPILCGAGTWPSTEGLPVGAGRRGSVVSRPAGGGRSGPGGNDVRRECPPAMARPACSVGEAQHLSEGALLMPSPRGGRTDNRWQTGDELCHQTRGLKDGPLECYQSCLDQDVRLSRSSVFSLRLPPAAPVAPFPPGFPSWLADPTLLHFSLCCLSCLLSSPSLVHWMASPVRHLVPFPLPPSSFLPLPSA